MNRNSFDTLDTLDLDGQHYRFFSLQKLAKKYDITAFPYCWKILLENALRNENGVDVSADDIEAICHAQRGLLSSNKSSTSMQISFSPSRVVLQDFTGVPALVDLAAMRDAVEHLGGKAEVINPLIPVDLVIDHSVMVDYFASADALEKNTQIEFKRNLERYDFLRWGQKSFNNFRVVPPGTGIVHQVNLEYLAQVVSSAKVDDELYAFPDSLVGTDSHTTMVNGLGVLAWGVGGIEAEAAMLGQAISMLLPEVVGFELSGKLAEGTTATDLVLKVTQVLRQHGVVGKFVEFHGDGLDQLSIADRATLSNMSPEYGATVGIFPVDQQTLDYLALTGRSAQQIKLVETYAKTQGLWRTNDKNTVYHSTLQLDLNKLTPAIAGPKRPQDRIPLTDTKSAFHNFLHSSKESSAIIQPASAEADFDAEGGNIDAELTSVLGVKVKLDGKEFYLQDGDIVIAAITSCTNTSNPSVMLAAGLLAKKAHELGLEVKPWVKTSLAPGSKVVPAYLKQAGLSEPLEALGFHVVGFGCTTCIGNSGPLAAPINEAIEKNALLVASVLSGNRNFEGRIHPAVKANYLASPPLVVAYALAGTMNIDLYNEPLGKNKKGEAVFLKDVWPTQEEINSLIANFVNAKLFQTQYADVFSGTQQWRDLKVGAVGRYKWPASSYIKKPPFFDGMTATPLPIKTFENARCLIKLGDSITTDHISPAGAIHPDSPAGEYLQKQGVALADFNSLGSRRGNHEVMMRGTFANVRIRNQLTPDVVGGYTRHFPSDTTMSVYDAAMRYKDAGIALVVLAGKEYGTGSSRDWAAKGTNLLGIAAVIAESYERIHRSNLVGFGVLPLQFMEGENANSLGLTGEEQFSLQDTPTPTQKEVSILAWREGARDKIFKVLVRIDTSTEWDYYINGGILHTVVRKLAAGQ